MIWRGNVGNVKRSYKNYKVKLLLCKVQSKVMNKMWSLPRPWQVLYNKILLPYVRNVPVHRTTMNVNWHNMRKHGHHYDCHMKRSKKLHVHAPLPKKGPKPCKRNWINVNKIGTKKRQRCSRYANSWNKVSKKHVIKIRYYIHNWKHWIA